MPVSQVHDNSPPAPVPLDHASSLLEGLPLFFFFPPFFPAADTPSEWAGSGPTRAGLMGGVWLGSTQEKEQRFLMILVTGLGDRSRHRSRSLLIH